MRSPAAAPRLSSVRPSSDLFAAGRTALRRLPGVLDIDVALALAAFGALLADPLLLHKVAGLTPVIVVLSLLAAVPLLARRRYPLPVPAARLPLPPAWLAVSDPSRS